MVALPALPCLDSLTLSLLLTGLSGCCIYNTLSLTALPLPGADMVNLPVGVLRHTDTAAAAARPLAFVRLLDFFRARWNRPYGSS
ncbi:hypothetical protein QBC46DRAFT_385369 [Diplogelasinospora grovesii]|uniref:Uncharacterized protein n=1 Tax=Diplogelasinospora grovesii TaxID=303347 RepID=A0AAN6S4Q0_9PEZI|nr:hypothetical protein QBC46DRAFT_385369 [Diplogelasinospora grovesii]